MPYSTLISLVFVLSTACQTGTLTVQADLPQHLKEISAVEQTTNSSLLWVIEDAGNKNEVYGLNEQGAQEVAIEITGAKNKDWEELTSDNEGNLYIGDIGNNNHKREVFTIYKIKNPAKNTTTLTAEEIKFRMPTGVKSKDFEAFFLYEQQFYLFSKENGKAVLLSVPNSVGTHTARLITHFKLAGNNTKITSADISDDGKTVVLLNHDNLWKLDQFTGDNFFTGQITALPFMHSSQKEGICFKSDSSVYITDEKNKSSGGNLYRFNLN